MSGKYFEEYYVSEEELRERIASSLRDLPVWIPEELDEDWVLEFDHHQPTTKMLEILAEKIPALRPLQHSADVLDQEGLLRCLAIQLDFLLDAHRLEYRVAKTIHRGFSTFHTGVEYLIASEIIESKLRQPLKYDPEKLIKTLFSSWGGQTQLRNILIAVKLANEETERLLDYDDEKRLFLEAMDEFDAAIEAYIEKNLPNVLLESFARIYMEAIVSNANIIDTLLNFGQPMTSEDRKAFAEEIRKIALKGTNFRMGIKRGGTRKRDGFRWDEASIESFYSCVAAIPVVETKKGTKDIWAFAFESFEYGGLENIISDSRFRELPSDLIEEAIREWEKHTNGNTKLQAKARPRMFLFRHALRHLDFPDVYSFSTLQKHYERGRKLTSESNFQNEV